MERVLIVAKTRMKSGVCVSGLTRTSNKGIRLLPKERFNQSLDTEFDLGQVWDIEFQEIADVDPPHVEDVIVINKQYKGHVASLRETLIQRVHPWRGGPEELFDKMLTIGPRKCYISRSGPIPSCSTGYWLPEKQLTLDPASNKPYYLVEHNYKVGGKISTQVLSIPFVGFASPVKQILPGTLIRVSLARWLSSPSDEDRCYLQISGWYM